jgi:hypothetical protein
MSVPTILEDTRPIACIAFGPQPNDINYTVGGPTGVTSIMPYAEPGEMGSIPWFAIYVGDRLVDRVPARMVIVVYAQDTVQ